MPILTDNGHKDGGGLRRGRRQSRSTAGIRRRYMMPTVGVEGPRGELIKNKIGSIRPKYLSVYKSSSS